MRSKFFLLTTLLALICLPIIAQYAGAGTTPGMNTQTMPPLVPSPSSGQESITATANRFATSYNQAFQDKEDLTVAAYNNDHERSQELIRSYNQNMRASKDSYQILQQIAENQGTGDITLFFPENSAEIPENDFQYNRLIRYLDSLERNNRDRKLVFIIMGSASATGEETHNRILSRNRANAPIPIMDQYLINVPHSYHKVYGTGEANSPQGEPEDINKRYRFVRIMALYEDLAPTMTGMALPMEPSPMMGQTLQSPAMAQRVQINEYINPIGMKFIRVPAGTFSMGSPDSEIRRDTNEILHTVTLTQPFYLQTTEVTQRQWLAVMGDHPSHFKNCGMDCPVENVRYSDVQKFLKRLNEMESTIYYRLPTEAEWEYAARAGTPSAFFNGPMVVEGDFSRNPYLDSVGWYYRNADHAPHLVAQKSANAWGFYDMHGNVWEWCSDWQRPYPFQAEIDPQGAEFGEAKIRRGGSWAHYPEYCRSAYRSWFDPEDRSPEIGFRVAITKLERVAQPAPPRPMPAPMPEPPPLPKPVVKAKRVVKKDLEPIPMPDPARVTQCILIRDISFDLDSSKINSRMIPLMDLAVELLNKYDGKIDLHGHTCSLGSKPYNMDLGLRRAESVKNYLVSKGINESRITTKSFGEEAPKFTNHTEAGRSLNRRVEILLHGFTNEQ
ncbi:MAG: SUMF1/EgtB/PvdO family nonheme iron enzyme [Proteobacteria bacterium]|nr:SUMF1/EgtB/PvdO family nonheme iron enzyme [Pseudomonadota bacterium]